MQYHITISVSTIFKYLSFYFTFFFLICSPQYTFNKQCLIRFHYNTHIRLFDFIIQYTIQKIFTKLQTTFQNEERKNEKELF